jgi:hypothetical protein
MRMSPITPVSPYMVPPRQKLPRAAFARHQYTFVVARPSLVRRVLDWLDKPFSLTDWR